MVLLRYLAAFVSNLDHTPSPRAHCAGSDNPVSGVTEWRGYRSLCAPLLRPFDVFMRCAMAFSLFSESDRDIGEMREWTVIVF